MAPRKSTTVAGLPGRDKTLPNVPLTLDGKTFSLAYSFNAIATAEELTGLELLGNVDLQNLNARSYRALLYSALLTGQPDITLDEVGNLITVANLPAITIALVHAWTGSRPEVVVDKQDKNPPVEQQEPEQNPS